MLGIISQIKYKVQLHLPFNVVDLQPRPPLTLSHQLPDFFTLTFSWCLFKPGGTDADLVDQLLPDKPKPNQLGVQQVQLDPVQ